MVLSVSNLAYVLPDIVCQAFACNLQELLFFLHTVGALKNNTHICYIIPLIPINTMSKLNLLLLALGITVVMSGCAGSYHGINPQALAYGYAPRSNAQVQLGYHHNILSEHRNKKFARKEQKKNIQLVAIEVTNNTDRSLTFGQDMQMYSGNIPVVPLDQEITYKSLRQQAPLFLLYLLLSPMQLNTTEVQNGQVETNSFPIGLIIGPGLALGNMLVANGNNQGFQQNLNNYDLTNRQIAPGETVYGLVGITKSYTAPLEMRILTVQPVEATEDYYKED